jgi:hypothetical protein
MAAVVALALAGDTSFARAAAETGTLVARPLGAIDVAGSVMQVRLDMTGRRVLVSTVRYPEGGMRQDELHLYELAAPDGDGRLLHRGTRGIDDVESVALARDGERMALGCEGGICIHRWGAAAIETRLAAPDRRREIGALALRPDVGLVVAAQRYRMEILSWELPSGEERRWAVAAPSERVREALTPRLHGRPPWIPRWVGVSPDGQRVASIRDDGTVSLWTRDGHLLKSLSVAYGDVDPAFTPAGRLVAARSWNGRLSVVDVEDDRVLITVDERPSRSPRRAALVFGGGVGYVATAGADGVVLQTLSSGAAVVRVPLPDEIWRITTSEDGARLAVATQHRVTLWSLSHAR